MSDEYESTLAEAAAKLQNVVTIGQVKHIGLRQVPGAIDMLIAEKDAEIAALQQKLEAADLKINQLETECGHKEATIGELKADNKRLATQLNVVANADDSILYELEQRAEAAEEERDALKPSAASWDNLMALAAKEAKKREQQLQQDYAAESAGFTPPETK